MTSPRSGPERAARRRFLAAAAGLALAGCAPREATVDGSLGTGETLAVDGVALHFRRAGRGPAVVLLHGASGTLDDWSFGALDAIAERNAVVAFDRPGLGRSGAPPEGVERLAVQAALMRRALAETGVARYRLVGHSYGGAVALAWALDAPDEVAGLMLIATPSQVWQGSVGLSTELLASPVLGPALARGVPLLAGDRIAEAAVTRIFAPQPAPPDYLDRLGRARVLDPGHLRVNARQLAALKEQVRAMAPRYAHLTMPVELLHGTVDRTVSLAVHSEPLAAQLAAARLTRLDGIGHMPHHAALPEVLVALDRLPRA